MKQSNKTTQEATCLGTLDLDEVIKYALFELKYPRNKNFNVRDNVRSVGEPGLADLFKFDKSGYSWRVTWRL